MKDLILGTYRKCNSLGALVEHFQVDLSRRHYPLKKSLQPLSRPATVRLSNLDHITMSAAPHTPRWSEAEVLTRLIVT